MVPLANKPWGQPVSKGQDQEEEEMGPRVAEFWISTGKREIDLDGKVSRESK